MKTQAWWMTVVVAILLFMRILARSLVTYMEAMLTSTWTLSACLLVSRMLIWPLDTAVRANQLTILPFVFLISGSNFVLT